MAFWKDKQGNELNFKQFMQRWKDGVNGITPLQQNKIQLQGTIISIAGIILGMIASLFALKTLWWLEIVLIGALINTTISAIGIYQKVLMYKNFQSLEQLEQIETEVIEKNV